jgi:hypothetical protein
MMTTDEIISEIQRKFKSSCPSGILLRWDRNRFYDSLVPLLAGYKVKNQTDYNYSYCNTFDIELNTIGSSGQRYKITLKTSFIVDGYAIHLTEYSNNRKQGKVIPVESVHEALFVIEKIKAFIEQRGFQKIDNEFNTAVPGVDLELAEIATIGKCLFDDF